MEVLVIISPDANVTIRAIDLVGDTWHDYLYYMAEAHEAEASNDLQAMNRALRTALGCLISHVDGVVSGLCTEAPQYRDDFAVPQGNRRGEPTLKSSISYLREYAETRIGKRLPYLRLHLKPLRDVLVHPSITKWDYASNVQLSQKDLFDLTVDALDKEGSHISRWLENLCLVYNYTRIHDTEQVCADLSVSLGQASETGKI